MMVPARIDRSDRFETELPGGAAGSWCLVTARRRGQGAWWCKLELDDTARGHVVREAFLGPSRHGTEWRVTLVHVPRAAGALALRMFTDGAAGAAPLEIHVRILSRAWAGVLLLGGGWRLLPSALRGDLAGLTGRVRAILGQAPARAGRPPPYAIWLSLYDCWGPAERDTLLVPPPDIGPIAVCIVDAEPDGLADTMASIAGQWLAPACISVFPADWQACGARWILVVGTGEILAPHALACLAHGAGRSETIGVFADVDCMVGGVRTAPLFKPPADPWLLRSGLPARGACLFRADQLSGLDTTANTGTLRQSAMVAASSGRLAHVPFILTHLPAIPAHAPSGPVGATPDEAAPFVSIIIPSAARSMHVLRCLRRLLASTDYPFLEVLLTVSRIERNDRAQASILRHAAKLPRVRVIDLDLAAFNYAVVNNFAAAQAQGELLLLLNDDVVPTDPLWLRSMVGVVEAPEPCRADIAGARLLYGNGRVQHGGVIMGLAGLCEHAFRLTARADAGPHGIACLDRQVSAVTGACMLVRRSLYRRLGGMDAAFAIALNDVDFCLRARADGARIAFAAGVTLVHYELLSLGRHYAGARAELEAVEVRRLSQRWASSVAADPFYNPCASLEPGREFQPAFPPRVSLQGWLTDRIR